MYRSDSPGLSRLLTPILQRHGRDATRLLQILREVQDACHSVPAGAIDLVAEHLAVPRVNVEGVAGFYSFLSAHPAGEYRLLFSGNITDQMLGKDELMQYLCNKLWVEPGRLSEDGLVSVDSTSCTGMCDQGPAALVNGWPLTNLDHNRLDLIAELIRSRKPVADWPPMLFEVADNVHRGDVLLGQPFEPGAAIRATLTDDTGRAVNNTSNSDIQIELREAGTDGDMTQTLLTIPRGRSASTGNATYLAGIAPGIAQIRGTVVSGHTYPVQTLNLPVTDTLAGVKMDVVYTPSSPRPGDSVTVTLRVLDANNRVVTTGSYAFQVKLTTSNNDPVSNGFPDGAVLSFKNSAYYPVDDQRSATNPSNDPYSIIGRTDRGIAELTLTYNRSGKVEITRFKGLGEMSAAQLWETAMNPDTRRLLPVAVDPAASEQTMRTFTMLMGKGEAPARRAWMERHGNEVEADV